MRITELRVDLENLDSVLERSRTEFLGSIEAYPDFRSRFSIGLLDPNTNIKYFELLESEEVCASFMLVYKQMRLNLKIVRVCFLTQVIVSKRFRGQGLTYRIAEYAERQAISDRIAVTFVVARRTVKDLYAKLGFVGFSHFCRISLREPGGSGISNLKKIISPQESDLKSILAMYEDSYSELNFHFDRCEESFKGILKLPKYCLQIASDKSFYFVSSSNEVIEIGMQKKVAKRDVVSTLLSEGFDCLKLHRDHEISKYAVSQGMEYSERFESREGHLLRIHIENLTAPQVKDLEAYTKFPGAQSAEILEIDQW
jgi:GNAT superfamily N-acetyltransferase